MANHRKYISSQYKYIYIRYIHILRKGLIIMKMPNFFISATTIAIPICSIIQANVANNRNMCKNGRGGRGVIINKRM